MFLFLGLYLSSPATATSSGGALWISCFQAENKHLGTLGGFSDFSRPTESLIQGVESFDFMLRRICTSALTLPSCVTLHRLLTLSESDSSSVEWEGGGGYSTCLVDRQ